MFKYTVDHPESTLSILAAGFRLYFASFWVSLVLSIVASLTFLSMSYAFMQLFQGASPYFMPLPMLLSAILGLVFFIPLIKRIYSVGAQLPISTPLAFTGFLKHFIQLIFFLVFIGVLLNIFPLVWGFFKPSIQPQYLPAVFFPLTFLYLYVALRLYFTPLFIVLENKGLWQAIKASIAVGQNHLWLTFCVLSLFYFAYWGVASMTMGHVLLNPIGVDLATEVLSVIALPLFLSIQLCQFFNLKALGRHPV
jgi:hypothetical protein